MQGDEIIRDLKAKKSWNPLKLVTDISKMLKGTP